MSGFDEWVSTVRTKWARLRFGFSALKQAYQLTFQGPIADMVLRDLSNYCRANETTHDASPELAKVYEGRRQVWIRIMEFLNLDPMQQWVKYGGSPDEW